MKKLYGEFQENKQNNTLNNSDSDDDDTVITVSDDSETGRDEASQTGLDDDSQTGRETEAPAFIQRRFKINIPLAETDDDTEATNTPDDPVDPRLLKEMKHLGGWFNPAAARIVDKAKNLKRRINLN